jgi:hypothetical protein
MQRTLSGQLACRRAIRTALESLEQRAMFSVAADLFVQPLGGPARLLDGDGGLHVQPLTSVERLRPGPTGTASPAAADGGAPVGYTPGEIRRAYGFDRRKFAGGAVRGDGSGQTIAIVDAFDDPNIEADLATFDRTFGLPEAHFTKVDQYGGTAFPVANTEWAGEIALDVEWAHALAPGANILLVEAADSSYPNMMKAVDFARRQAGVSVVSMSWGGPEFASETVLDNAFFTTPAGHQGVTFVASTGDDGARSQYPASSPNVVAVGGTSLYTDGRGGYGSEVGWSGSGGGVSRYERRPAYQGGVSPGRAYRSAPDVAFDADPYTGVAICDSFGLGDAYNPWVQIGGTSFSAPAWASLIAVLNQGRAVAGQGSMDGASETLPALYAAPSRDFHDVVDGSNGYSASAGYDLVTGLGSPDAPSLVRDLVGDPGAADLSVAWSHQPPRRLAAGDRVEATVRVSNLGDAPARGMADVTFYASRDGTLEGAVMLRQAQARLRLKAGASAECDYPVRIPRTLAGGEYRLVAVVNRGGAIPEQDGANNLAASGPVHVIGAGGYAVPVMAGATGAAPRAPFSARRIAAGWAEMPADSDWLAAHPAAAEVLA